MYMYMYMYMCMSIKCHHTVTVITLVLLSVQYSKYGLTTVTYCGVELTNTCTSITIKTTVV